jgi:hypothetical protein
MSAMEAARFNVFWFMWLLAPMAIMLFATRERSSLRLIVGSLASILATFVFSILAVERKWSIRLSEAVTPEELEYATTDGANMAFTLLFLAPAEAVFFTLVWGLVGRYAWAKQRAIGGRST